MKVFITDTIPQVGINNLKNANVQIKQWNSDHPITYDELLRESKDCDALILVMVNFKLDDNFFKNTPNLKAIALFSVGYDSVDMQAATKYNIPVSNTPQVLSNATADVSFLLLIATSRKAFYMHNQIIAGEWGKFKAASNLGTELDDKTLGVFGLGSIGFEMARKCKGAYNMNIIYHNRHRNEKAEKELGAKYVSYEELLQQSDVLSVHCNLTEETKGIFNKDVFRKMKESSIFINVSRGAIHNEADLIDALEKKQIWGAGLDVTNPEPMAKDNPLLFMPNVSVTPHIGSATIETRNAMAALCVQNIIEGLQGNKLLTVVNEEVYS